MKEFSYTITDTEGLHARPASLLVKAAGQFQSHIFMYKNEKKADLKKIFAVMGLGVKNNQEISVIIEGEDEEQAMEAISSLLKENL